MRQTLLCFCVAWASIGYAESPKALTSETLMSVLTSQKVVTFSIDRKSMVYRLGLLDDELVQLSTAYYANRSENIVKYREIFDKVLKEQDNKQRDRLQASSFPGRGESPATELEKELRRYARPTGSPVGEITRVGADFIAIKELGSSTEYLIPFDRILDVSVPASMQAKEISRETDQ